MASAANPFAADELAQARLESAKRNETKNVQRVRRVRGCNVDVFWFVYGVRLLSAFCGLGVATISIFGLFMAHNLFQSTEGTVPNLYGTTWKEFGVFVGIMSVYSFIAGWLVLLAELRFAAIKRHVLVHFAFLNHFIGRFLFYVFLGTMLLAVGHIGPRIVGGFLIASGCCQLFISILVSKDILPYSEQDDAIDGLFGGADGSTKAPTKKAFGKSQEPDTSWAHSSAPAENSAPPPAASTSRQERTSRAASTSKKNPLAAADTVAATPPPEAATDSSSPTPPVPPPGNKAEPVEPTGGTADNPWG